MGEILERENDGPSLVDCSAADLGFLTLPKVRLTGCGSDRNGTHAQLFLNVRQSKIR